ncbi:hypothetical protein AV530_006062 [Patagioenas fasciata monilis]|uniref:Uncharacterized protein n=1 Tax=Patagioenas fasciata monilis TaxID=372326 RepID=A0A1V4J8J2_PATFA|nr:hypothetical protein AV530_006062 [Patagioenas fasciata monilis]
MNKAEADGRTGTGARLLRAGLALASQPASSHGKETKTAREAGRVPFLRSSLQSQPAQTRGEKPCHGTAIATRF